MTRLKRVKLYKVYVSNLKEEIFWGPCRRWEIDIETNLYYWVIGRGLVSSGS
jgi:hypothetical protein